MAYYTVGTTLGTCHGLVTESGGDMYAFFLQTTSYPSPIRNNLRIRKSTDGGENWSQILDIASTTAFGSAASHCYFRETCLGIDIDSSDVIHIVATGYGGSSRTIAYATLTTSTDSMSSWSNASSSQPTANLAGDIDGMIDDSDVFHIVFTANYGSGYYLYYSNNSSGWITNETISTIGETQQSMLLRSDGSVGVLYALYTYQVGEHYRERSSGGTWGTVDDWTNESTNEYAIASKFLFEYSGDLYLYAGYWDSNHDFFENDTDTGVDIDVASETGFRTTLYNGGIYLLYTYDAGSYDIIYVRRWTPGSGTYGSPQQLEDIQMTGGARLEIEFSTFNKNYTENHCIIFNSTGSGDVYYATIPESYDSDDTKHAFLAGDLEDSTKLYPASDVYTTGWLNEASGSTLYPSLEDSSDSTYAWYQHAIPGAYFEVTLDALGGTPDTGSQYIEWRAYKKAGAQSVTLKCELRQGSSTSIASDTKVLTTSVAEYVYELTGGEISSISNYDDLRIRVTIMDVT